jgi:hypothetical protein
MPEDKQIIDLMQQEKSPYADLIQKDQNPYMSVLGKENVQREPNEAELDYFKSNPHVGGMATEDQRIILNPHTTLTPAQQEYVKQNELARLIMMKKGVPEFQLTPEQQQYFATMNQGKPYGPSEAIRATILGRIVSGDETAQNPTPEQINHARQLNMAIQNYLSQFKK